MSTPNYKGPGQPSASTNDGVTGWLGGFLGGSPAPSYKSAPTAPPAPPPCAPCPPCPTEATKPAPTCPASTPKPAATCPTVPTPMQMPTCPDVMPPEPFVLPDCGDAVIPVGPGPITIVIQPAASRD